MAIITDYHHWEYFLSLENNLINLSRYIEFRGVDNPTSINACAYSIELTKIFLAACAECENILKILAPCPPSITKEKYNIKKIKINLEDNFSPIFNQLVDTNIYLPTYNICFNPWQHWKTQDSPPRWWSAHNRIKHNRTQRNYELANVYNTLNSVTGLMCLLFHAMKEQKPNSKLKCFLFHAMKKKEPNSSDYQVLLPFALTPKLFSPKTSTTLNMDKLIWIWSE